MSTAVFYSSGFAFLVGVICAVYTPFGYAFPGMLVGVACGLFIILKTVYTDSRIYSVTCVVLIAMACGIFRMEYAVNAFTTPVLDTFSGKNITIIGTVRDERDERDSYTQLTVSVDSVMHDGEIYTVSDASVLVFAPRYPVYEYADKLRITGTLETPQLFETDTGRVFQYDTFLAVDDVSHTLFYPKIESVATDDTGGVVGMIFRLKQSFLYQINRSIPEPQSALAGGILLGVKQSLGDVLEKQFRVTGLIHVVVLSGYNVTIVAVAIMSVLSRIGLGIRIRTIVGMSAIALFAVMVGLGATVVRASILASLVVLSRAFGRHFNIHRALLLAGVIMVGVNPFVLMYDPSFQLSFIATIGLVYLTPLIEPLFRFVPRWGGMFEIATATVSTQVAVWPLLVYLTGSFSLVALPVNLLALPLIAPAMLFSFLAGLLYFVSFFVAWPVTISAYVLLSIIITIVEVFSELPFSHMVIPPFSVWFMVGMYAVSCAGLLWWYRRNGFVHSSAMAERIERSDVVC